jgi:orotate phosphoribosyltransferase
VIVIEDLISTGESSIKAVKALKDAGANVKGLLAIFTYGFDVAEEKFKDAACPAYALSDYKFLIQQALV